MVIFCGLLVFNILPGWDGGNGGLGFTGMFAAIQSQKSIANNTSAGLFAAIIVVVRRLGPFDITLPALVLFIDDTGCNNFQGRPLQQERPISSHAPSPLVTAS